MVFFFPRWSQKWRKVAEKGGKSRPLYVEYVGNQPDTLQKKKISLLVNLDIPIDTKRLKG